MSDIDKLLEKLCNGEAEEDDVVKMWEIIGKAKNMEQLLMDSCWKNSMLFIE